MKIKIITFFMISLSTKIVSGQIFEAKPDLTSIGRDGGVAFSTNSKVYFAAGISNKDLWEYDPALSKWTRKSDVSGVITERAFAVGVAIGNKAYIGLGDDRVTSSSAKKDWWEYDIPSDSWTRKADFPGVARDACAYFAVNGKVYVGGGTDNTFIYPDFYEYDPGADKWTSKGNLPTGPVVFPSCFTIGNKAYMVGGSIGTSEINDLNEYDPVTNIWTSKAPFPGFPRQTAFAFSLDNEGYVGHGMSGYVSIFDDIYKYSPISNKWSLVSATNNPSARCWVPSATIGNKAYVGTGLVSFAPISFTNSFYEFTIPSTSNIYEKEDSNTNISVTPNPAKDYFQLYCNFPNEVHIEVYNIFGQKLMQQTIYQKDKINISHLPPQQYFVKFNKPDGTSIIKRLVKQ